MSDEESLSRNKAGLSLVNVLLVRLLIKQPVNIFLRLLVLNVSKDLDERRIRRDSSGAFSTEYIGSRTVLLLFNPRCLLESIIL